MKTKNQTSLKNFEPTKNLNHNIQTIVHTAILDKTS